MSKVLPLFVRVFSINATKAVICRKAILPN